MKYFDAFAGYGGFSLGIKQAYEELQNGESSGGLRQEESLSKRLMSNSSSQSNERQYPTCVGFSEIDKYAIQVYNKHFNHKNYGDITKLDSSTLPDFDLFCGGFPCQAFSIAGRRRGFNDTRGTLFFDVARIIKEKQPRLLLLENVKGLLSHEQGATFRTILRTLDELRYDCQWQVLNAKNFGVPQNRERVFIIGQLRGTRQVNVFPLEYKYEQNIEEKMYSLSKDVSSYGRTLLLGMEQSKAKELSFQQMQSLFEKIKQGIQKKECGEIKREPQELRQESEGNIQEVETLGAYLGSENDTGGIYSVVQAPTEEMLLLWSKGKSIIQSGGQIQQQDTQNDDRQNRLKKTLRAWEHSPLLFAVQPYQGRLFYSIGDGKDWVNVYKIKMEKICQQQISLSSILEEQVDQKYFLSEEAVAKIVELSKK